MDTTPGDGVLSPLAFTRDDESSDDRFYVVPRKVVHIDDGAIAALGELYAEILPSGGRLLDLMSSWRSHLPPGFRAGTVVGLGLNAEEMADNPQLGSHVVHDVNRDPRLPFGDAEFDGAMCAVSIQYVIHPVLLLREAWAFRANATAYDALYLAAAVLRHAPLLTADGPLSRAPVKRVTVHNIRN